MKGFLLALAILLGTIMDATALDYIVNAPNDATMVAVAQAGGFYQEPSTDRRGNVQPGRIITSGTLAGGGSWYFNYAGVVKVETGGTVQGPRGPVPEKVDLPGVWARLRLNGYPTEALANLIAMARNAGVTVYTQELIGPLDARGNPTRLWTADGVTPAPDYVAGIALIQ
jgi:hypothetical protein